MIKSGFDELTALAFLTRPDKGGLSRLNRLKSHLAGNRSERALVDRAIVEALIAIADSRIEQP